MLPQFVFFSSTHHLTSRGIDDKATSWLYSTQHCHLLDTLTKRSHHFAILDKKDDKK